MECLVCKNLERAFESGHSQYLEARSAAYYRVSTELAAYKNVEMERARSDLEEHQFVCVSADKVRQSGTMHSRACLGSTLGRHTGDIELPNPGRRLRTA